MSTAHGQEPVFDMPDLPMCISPTSSLSVLNFAVTPCVGNIRGHLHLMAMRSAIQVVILANHYPLVVGLWRFVYNGNVYQLP